MIYSKGDRLIYQLEMFPRVNEFLIYHRGATLLLALLVAVGTNWILFYGNKNKRSLSLVISIFTVLNILSIVAIYGFVTEIKGPNLSDYKEYIVAILLTDWLVYFQICNKTTDKIIRPMYMTVLLFFTLYLTYMCLNFFTPVFALINWGSRLQ